VQAVATFQPDVVLLDIGMPKLNGYEAAHIRQQPWGKHMVLVAVTGPVEPAVLASCGD
jgi:CheY-like chemotaxis protein